MTTQEQINEYINSQPGAKKLEIEQLHRMIVEMKPGVQLWFLDGRKSENKIVSNPNIGYGFYTIQYAGGKTRDFYQVGLSGNSTGLSVYIMGIADKTYLENTYGSKIGKAKVTGYCIKFKSLKDIDLDVLKAAMLDGFKLTGKI